MKSPVHKLSKKVIVILIISVFYMCTKKVAKQTEVTPPPLINTNCKIDITVSYSQTVQQLLNTNCLPCHSSPSAFALDNYDGTKAVASSGNLVGVLTGDPSYTKMPPNKIMDSCDIKTIVKWVNQGFQNN